MKVEIKTTKEIHLTLTEEQANILAALVQNPPVNAGKEVRTFMEDLFTCLTELTK